MAVVQIGIVWMLCTSLVGFLSMRLMLRMSPLGHKQTF